jgi:hypothetical protein
VEILKAYLDESADDHSYTVAGITGTAEQLCHLEREWKEIKRDIKTIHMNPLMRRKGEFEGWSDKRASTLLDRSVGAICRRASTRQGFTVLKRDFEAIYAEQPEFKDMYPNLYVMTAIKAISACGIWAKKHKGRLSICFDRGNPNQDSLQAAIDLAREMGILRNYGIVDPIEFADDEDVLSLQAADVVAWECRREATCETIGDHRWRRSMERLCSMPGSFKLIGGSDMRREGDAWVAKRTNCEVINGHSGPGNNEWDSI